MSLNLFEEPINESDIRVDVNLVKEFTPKNLEVLKALRNQYAHPELYGSAAPDGINFCETILIDVSDIDDNNKGNNQLVRATMNASTSEIASDIKTYGYSLAELPICVTKTADGKYRIEEGRTRFNILRDSCNMKNIIADVFEQTDDVAALKFGLDQNVHKKPHGRVKNVDIIKVIKLLVEWGEIDRNAPNFLDLVMAEAQQRNPKLTDKQINKIALAVANSAGVISVVSYSHGHGVDKWLIENGYTDTRGIKYHPVSTFEEKVIMTCVTQLANNPTLQELRLVVHGGELEVKDVEADWLNRVAGFKASFENTLTRISNAFFGGAAINLDRIKLYGAVPMVKSLEDKYPMDELYLFD